MQVFFIVFGVFLNTVYSFIELKVVPCSGFQKWTLDKSGKIKCYLKSPPEAGKANKELVALLSKLLKVPQDSIKIELGLSSRTKRIRIPLLITQQELLCLLGIEQQLAL